MGKDKRQDDNVLMAIDGLMNGHRIVVMTDDELMNDHRTLVITTNKLLVF